jgi:serine/threonine protein kinase
MTAPENPPDNYIYKPGDIVGESYVLLSVLAKGGMGVVYKARHLQLDKTFALKLLTPVQTTSANWKRFELEARMLAKLEHKNIVQIFNMGVDVKGCPYYVMELLQGQSMAEALDSLSPMPVPQFIQSFLDVCSALQLAHSKGIVHRDIKPSNLILLDSHLPLKQTKVVDFGIARLVGVEGQSAQNLTLPGEIFGSPLYMSPEQTLGLPVTMSSDIYSLGCTMFEAFTGSPPFKGQSALATMMMHQTDAMPDILRDNCPDREFDLIVQIISKCMQKQASDRFANVGEVFDRLGNLSTVASTSSDFKRSSALLAQSKGSSNFSKSEESSQTFAETDGQGNVAKGNKLTAFAIGLALVFGLGTMAVVYATLIKPKTAKPVVSASATIASHLTRENPLPAFETTLQPTAPFANDTTPVSWLVSRKGKVWREFEFPKGQPVGNITIDGLGKRPAVGHITCPNDRPASFDSTDALAQTPQFYKRFDPEALCYVMVKDTNKPPSISTLASWKNLGTIIFERCQLKDQYVRDLRKLPYLRQIIFNNSHVSGLALVESGIVPGLTRLDLYGVSQYEVVLKALNGSKNINHLALRKVALDDAQIALLASLPNLAGLDLRNAELPDSALESIAHFPKLKRLLLTDARFDTSTMANLAHSKSIIGIEADAIALTPSTRARLKAALPGLNLVEE